jgi:ABC-type uncharacterized transport system substrate-binding protein
MKKMSIMICLFILSSGYAYAKPKILLIESYHQGYQWDINYRNAIKDVLGNKVELESFFMDTKRLKTEKYQQRADLAWQKYLDYQPDLVILGDDNAMMLMAPKLIKTNTPVVYLGVNNNPRNYARLSNNITGVLERPLYKRTMTYLKDLLHKSPFSILIMFDVSTTSKIFKDLVFKDNKSISFNGIRADVRNVPSYEDWKYFILNAKELGYSAIVLGLYERIFDGDRYVSSDEVITWTSANTPLPLFAFWEMTVGQGKAVGGMVLSGEVQGRAAAHIVEKILNGVPAEKIVPVTPKQGAFVFSRHELQRWKILLPEKIKSQAKFVD